MMDVPAHYTNNKKTVQNNGQQILKFTRNKKTGLWEVTLETQQSKMVLSNILDQTTTQELAHYLHSVLFSLTTTSLLKETKMVFLTKWTGLTERFINRNIEKPINTAMGHLHMILQGLQSTRNKPPDTKLEDK